MSTQSSVSPDFDGLDTIKRALERAMASNLAQLDRDHVTRWSKDPRAEEVWATISSRARSNLLTIPPRVFVGEMLSCRAMAQRSAPQFQFHAEAAESLANFLRGSEGQPPAMPSITEFYALAQSLEDAASLMRTQAHLSEEKGLIKNSRKSKTNPRANFIRLVSDFVFEVCGMRLDYEVGMLTEKAFPGIECSEDMVRAARR
jgi:hypothetical protein